MKKNKYPYGIILFFFLFIGRNYIYGVEYILLLTHENDHEFNTETKKKYDFLIDYIKKEVLTPDQTRFSFIENDILPWLNLRFPFRDNSFSLSEDLLNDKYHIIDKSPSYAITFRDENGTILVDIFEVQEIRKPSFRLNKNPSSFRINLSTRRDDSKFNTLINDISNEVKYYLKNNRPRKQIFIAQVENKTLSKELPDAESLKKSLSTLADIFFIVRDQPISQIPLTGLYVLNCRYLEQKKDGDKTLIKTELLLYYDNNVFSIISSEVNPNKKDIYLDKNTIISDIPKNLNSRLPNNFR